MAERTAPYYNPSTGVWEKIGSGDTIVQTAPDMERLISSETAAASTVIGNVVYMNGDGKAALCDADTVGLTGGFLVSLEDKDADAACRYATSGEVVALFVTGLTLNEGENVFLSATAGSVTNVAPSSGYIKKIGVVKDASSYSSPTTLTATIHLAPETAIAA